jgi:hypothetical protein
MNEPNRHTAAARTREEPIHAQSLRVEPCRKSGYSTLREYFLNMRRNDRRMTPKNRARRTIPPNWADVFFNVVTIQQPTFDPPPSTALGVTFIHTHSFLLIVNVSMFPELLPQLRSNGDMLIKF